MEKFTVVKKDKINELPKTAGVYCFIEEKNTIYIGKAINIRDRVKNHFKQPSYRDNLFMNKVEKIGFINTGSEIEALILEANLIKKNQPKFNVVWRDDKNYFYVALRHFTPQGKLKNKDNIPYIFITHQKNDPKTEYIGPFVEGNSLKKTLKFLRKVFPYYTTRKHPRQKCTWCHLDLCPGPELYENPPSPKASEGLREYKKSIKKLTLILKGKRKTVLYALKKEMQIASEASAFEKAGKLRDKIYALEQIMSHTSVIENQNANIKNQNATNEKWIETQSILQGLLDIDQKISRVECYDISNIQGKYAVGSMVVFINGKSDTNEYKKFRIRMKQEPNDIAMLKEVLERRFSHPEWIYPEIILIDGGIAQLNIAIKTKNQVIGSIGRTGLPMAETIQNIKVLSIAKRLKELFIEGPPLPICQKANGVGAGKPKKILLKTLPQEIFNLIIGLDDEAHRFAISYHKKLRKEGLGLDKK